MNIFEDTLKTLEIYMGYTPIPYTIGPDIGSYGLVWGNKDRKQSLKEGKEINIKQMA